MENYLFRGKAKGGSPDGKIVNDKWYYGSYKHDKLNSRHYIIDERNIEIEVRKETVGQYTGKTSINAEKIFTGDFVKGIKDFDGEVIAEIVTYDENTAQYVVDDYPLGCISYIEVIKDV